MVCKRKSRQETKSHLNADWKSKKSTIYIDSNTTQDTARTTNSASLTPSTVLTAARVFTKTSGYFLYEGYTHILPLHIHPYAHLRASRNRYPLLGPVIPAWKKPAASLLKEEGTPLLFYSQQYSFTDKTGTVTITSLVTIGVLPNITNNYRETPCGRISHQVP